MKTMHSPMPEVKKSLVLSAILTLLLAGTSVHAEERPEAGGSDFLAVTFYADWCGSCRVLDPRVDAVKKEFAGESILFTRVDHTDEFTTEQSKLFANLIGIESIYDEAAGATGFLLVIDRRNNEIVERLRLFAEHTEDWETAGPEDLEACHLATSPRGSSFGVFMDREDACTVSLCRVDIDPTRVRMTYRPRLAGGRFGTSRITEIPRTIKRDPPSSPQRRISSCP
jgi:thiol-disulfide isomerase/thioredoxin